MYPWDLGYGRNDEWIHLISLFDSIESELDAWNKLEKKKEELEDSNAIPPRKESIGQKVDSASKKKKKEAGDKSIQIEVPWKHTKKTIKGLRDMFGI